VTCDAARFASTIAWSFVSVGGFDMVKATRKAGKKNAKDIKSNQKSAPESKYPPPEDEFGGGDFVSPEEDPLTDDDKPLD
jgi:hypothetical protein